jgi:plastocyanin
MSVATGFCNKWLALAGLTGVLLLTACGSSGSSATTGGGSAAATGRVSPASAGSGSPAASAAADTIVITNFMFAPASLTVAPGTVVTVRNEDSVTHTLADKADPQLFQTGDIAAGQSKTFKAPGTAGSYGYICTIHQYMSGTLVVR